MERVKFSENAENYYVHEFCNRNFNLLCESRLRLVPFFTFSNLFIRFSVVSAAHLLNWMILLDLLIFLEEREELIYNL